MKRVLVGMSGGVDSSVTALLLKQQGYEVVGVTFRLWTPDVDEPESSCCSIDDVNDARFVCDSLSIPHYVFNYKDLFNKKVVENFANEYKLGRTPNPCILCNKHIKFDAFIQKAESMGFDYVATGHYARIIRDEATGHCSLAKAACSEKDQTYVLYNITQCQIQKMLMPLGDYSKEQVREIAKANQLVTFKKPDSQDICFVPDGDYVSFLEKYTGETCTEGNFIDIHGNILGKHKGIWHYTIGQRKGLGIALGEPYFVKNIDPVANTVTLAKNDEIFSNSLIADELNFIEFDKLDKPLSVSAKIRYSHKCEEAIISPLEDGRVLVEFKNPQRAITKGQSVVFYNDDIVLGGGIIAE